MSDEARAKDPFDGDPAVTGELSVEEIQAEIAKEKQRLENLADEEASLSKGTTSGLRQVLGGLWEKAQSQFQSWRQPAAVTEMEIDAMPETDADTNAVAGHGEFADDYNAIVGQDDNSAQRRVEQDEADNLDSSADEHQTSDYSQNDNKKNSRFGFGALAAGIIGGGKSILKAIDKALTPTPQSDQEKSIRARYRVKVKFDVTKRELILSLDGKKGLTKEQFLADHKLLKDELGLDVKFVKSKKDGFVKPKLVLRGKDAVKAIDRGIAGERAKQVGFKKKEAAAKILRHHTNWKKRKAKIAEKKRELSSVFHQAATIMKPQPKPAVKTEPVAVTANDEAFAKVVAKGLVWNARYSGQGELSIFSHFPDGDISAQEAIVADLAAAGIHARIRNVKDAPGTAIQIVGKDASLAIAAGIAGRGYADPVYGSLSTEWSGKVAPQVIQMAKQAYDQTHVVDQDKYLQRLNSPVQTA